MDLFEDNYIFTVSELTRKIKSLLEENFSHIYVEGEISNLNISPSGHTYFTLKDKKSQLKAVLFKGFNKNIKFDIEDGLNVICCGEVTVYGPRGQYQIIVKRIEPKGLGALQLAFQQLKEKLQKEGLFDKKHKRNIPYLPNKIGIVTSPTGKAIKDILNVMDRRFSNLEIFLVPVRVQGKKAADEIANGIALFNKYRKVDVIITGRGGGSLEDLWAFNEEVVARAIYESDIPIISAVGHEPDVTISDLVADLRVPTPSAAAELVVNKKQELQEKIDNLFFRLNNIALGKLKLLDARLKGLMETYFLRKGPQDILLYHQQRVDDFIKNMYNSINYSIDLKYEKFRTVIGKLESLSPLSILSRGYSITRKFEDGEVIKSFKVLSKGEKIQTLLANGSVVSKIEDIKEK